MWDSAGSPAVTDGGVGATAQPSTEESPAATGPTAQIAIGPRHVPGVTAPSQAMTASAGCPPCGWPNGTGRRTRRRTTVSSCPSRPLRASSARSSRVRWRAKKTRSAASTIGVLADLADNTLGAAVQRSIREGRVTLRGRFLFGPFPCLPLGHRRDAGRGVDGSPCRATSRWDNEAPRRHRQPGHGRVVPTPVRSLDLGIEPQDRRPASDR